jgi:hypothetical protein
MMRTGSIEPRYSRVMKKQTHCRSETRRAEEHADVADSSFAIAVCLLNRTL